MLRKILLAFVLAFQNIRSNFFHTILSILGIVIGVAALVGILSLIDGAEEFARRQLSQTTSLNAVIIQSETVKRVNDVRVKKDSFQILNYNEYLEIKSRFENRTTVYCSSTASGEVFAADSIKSFGAVVYGAVEGLKPEITISAGRLFNATDLENQSMITILNHKAATIISPDSQISELLGSALNYHGRTYTVIGILDDKESTNPEIFIPLTTLPPEEMKLYPPIVALQTDNIEEVPEIKEDLFDFIVERYGEENDLTIVTNEFRVEQAKQAFLLFRVVMGIIVGISVLVGGIGVMNVLLISVTERTPEIGIRKAVGANRKDLILQFMCEAITVSTFGSIAGLVAGVLGTIVAVPIIRIITKAPFEAVFTANTLVVVSLVALAVGLIFGTYPAFRASRLDPVEAIRRD